MKKTEWLEYFELVNGREANDAEISDALSKGEFQEEVLETVSESEEVISDMSESFDSERVSRVAAQSESEIASESPAEIKEPKVISNKKFCIKCGNELALEAKFCTKCGTAQDGSSPAQASSESEFQETLNGYWGWMKKTLRYPISTATSEMTDNYMWITFSIIVGVLSTGFAILFGSFAFFFITLIFGAGLSLLLNALYGSMANGLMKTKFKFFDIFKMNMQASIYAVPISVAVFVFCILAKLMLNSAMNNPYNFVSSLVFVNVLGFIIYAMLAFVALVGADLFIMAVYRETLAVKGSKIDNYPWFKLLYVVVVTIIVFVLFLILGSILYGIIGDSFMNNMGY